MRLTLYCLLVVVSSFSLQAQSNEDFAPFRWELQYTYHNPAPAPEWTTETPLHLPLVGVLSLDDAWQQREYRSLLPTATEGQYRLVPHFAGIQREVSNTGEAIFSGEEGWRFSLRYGAPVGEVWLAAPGYECRVDSIVTESVFDQVDEVKYISVVRLTDGTKLPSIKIGRSLGLLRGLHFSDPDLIAMVYSVAGIAFWNETYGEEFVFPGAIAAAQPNDDYFEQSEREVDGGTRVTQRILRNRGFERCDPLFGGFERLFYLREISYLRPADGSANKDTVVQPPQDFFTVINNSTEEYLEHAWVTTPLGTIYTPDDPDFPTMQVVEHHIDDCLGTGIRLSRQLIYNQDGTVNISSDPDQYTPVFYHSVARANHTKEVIPDQNFRLVGVNTHRAVCGEQFNFDPFYTSTYDFPNDDRVTLAPNPATDRTMFSVPFDLGPVNLTVYDAAGRELRTTSFSGGDRWLETGDLAAGVYTVVVASREGPVARRRVVVR